MLIVVVILIGIYVFDIFYTSNQRKKEFAEKANRYQQYKELGFSLLTSGSYAEALEKLNEAITTCPKNLSSADAKYGLPLCYLGLKQYDEVLSNSWWRNKEDEYYYKAIAAKEMGRTSDFKKYIELGIVLDYDRFNNLILKYYNTQTNANDFVYFLTENTLFQLIRNVKKEELLTDDASVVSKLNEINKNIVYPFLLSTNMEYHTLLAEAKECFNHVNLDKFFSKEYLFLNNIELKYLDYKKTKSTKSLIIYDLIFLRNFKKLKALSLAGQMQIRNYEPINFLGDLKELNVTSSNFKDTKLKNEAVITIIRNKSGLNSFREEIVF